MSNAKRLKISKGETIFFSLKLKDTFLKDAKNLRLHFGIPKKGFSKIENIEKWEKLQDRRLSVLSEKDQRKNPSAFSSLKFRFGLVELLKKHNLPTAAGFLDRMEEYILGGDRFQLVKKSNNISCAIEAPSEEDIRLRDGRSFIKLIIYDTATSHEDVREFIKDEWSIIRTFLKNKNRRIKPSKDIERIKGILELNKLSTEMLYKLVKIGNNIFPPDHNRYNLIGELLRPKMKGQAVQKTVMRYKKKSRDI